MITVTRADILVPVTAERVLAYIHIRIGYVQLTSFTDGSGAEVRAPVARC